MKKKHNLELKLIPVLSDLDNNIEIQVYSTKVPAGFPSPADGYMDIKMDLNKYLIKHPASTFCFWVEGHSMTEVGIFDGDLLIVDCSLSPLNNDIILGVIDGEFTVKQIQKINDKLYLQPKNKDYKPLEINEYMNFQIRGIVIKAIHNFRK
jgi:DNA polymerase V